MPRMRPGYVNDIFEWPGKCARQTQAMKTEIPMTTGVGEIEIEMERQ